MTTANAPERATRQVIVDTTARLLESQGYHGTGLNQIIKESGAPLEAIRRELYTLIDGACRQR